MTKGIVTNGPYINNERSCVFTVFDIPLPQEYIGPLKDQPYCQFFIADPQAVVLPGSFECALGQTFYYPFGKKAIWLGCQWVKRPEVLF